MIKNKQFSVALTDKVIKKYMDDNNVMDFLNCSDEGEAVAIAGGYWLAKKERANVYFSADGLCNALNFLTSWIIPEEIEMNLFISTGRMETPHKEMTRILPDLLKLLQYDTERINITVVQK